MGGLSGEVFIVRHGGSGPQMYSHLVRRLSEMGLPPQIRRLNVGQETLLRMVAQGYGVTLTTEAAAVVPVPGIVFRELADEPELVHFSAVWSPHNCSRALRDFLDLAQCISRAEGGCAPRVDVQDERFDPGPRNFSSTDRRSIDTTT